MFSERLARVRLGQSGFRATVFNAYHRRCAITGTKIWPALDAAHIRPVAEGGEHRIDNGLLLRSDVHTMFDRGYLGVDPSYRLQVSPRLRDEFGNGEQFYSKAGEVIALPTGRPTGPTASSWSGTSTPYSEPRRFRRRTILADGEVPHPGPAALNLDRRPVDVTEIV